MTSKILNSEGLVPSTKQGCINVKNKSANIINFNNFKNFNNGTWCIATIINLTM